MSVAQTPTTSNSPTRIHCPHCGVIDQHSVRPVTDRGPHTHEMRCTACGRHIKWMSARTPEEQAARREQAHDAAMAQRPPSVRQLDLLCRLGYAGSAIGTMLSASVTISGLLSQRRQEGRV